MRIVPYTDLDENIEDINTLLINIKSVPFEDDYVPSFIIVTPSEDYIISINELNALMDGIEIAKNEIDSLINYLLKFKIKQMDIDPFLNEDDENE